MNFHDLIGRAAGVPAVRPKRNSNRIERAVDAVVMLTPRPGAGLEVSPAAGRTPGRSGGRLRPLDGKPPPGVGSGGRSHTPVVRPSRASGSGAVDSASAWIVGQPVRVPAVTDSTGDADAPDDGIVTARTATESAHARRYAIGGGAIGRTGVAAVDMQSRTRGGAGAHGRLVAAITDFVNEEISRQMASLMRTGLSS